MMKVISIALFIFTLVACKGNQKKYLLNKPLPKSEIAMANLGDVIVSHSNATKGAADAKSTFIYWRLLRVDAKLKSLIFNYEEYYDILKEKPDLAEERKFDIKDKLTLDQYELILYQVSNKSIIYQVQIKR